MFKSKTSRTLDITTAFLIHQIAILRTEIDTVREKLSELETEYEHGE
jgi:hypothetical protein